MERILCLLPLSWEWFFIYFCYFVCLFRKHINCVKEKQMKHLNDGDWHVQNHEMEPHYKYIPLTKNVFIFMTILYLTGSMLTMSANRFEWMDMPMQRLLQFIILNLKSGCLIKRQRVRCFITVIGWGCGLYAQLAH